jgi:hypothetical protein
MFFFNRALRFHSALRDALRVLPSQAKEVKPCVPCFFINWEVR